MKKFLFYLIIQMVSFQSFAQESSGNSLNFFSDILGKRGVSLFIAAMFFFFAYKNSIKLFAWIEDQTYGTRDFVLNKCELLHFEIDPKKVTILLIALSFGSFVLIFGFFSLMGKFLLGGVLGILVGFLGWKLPRPVMNMLVERRIKQYSNQMVDALNLLSNGLRAGLSVPQSLGMVVDELPAPVSEEFNTILQQTKIGVPIEEAFENLVKRVPTEDNDMFVTSINILRETGGNLAEVFDTITDVIRERVRLAQKIDTYVAQGKFQGGIIFAMPFAMAAIYTASDPKSMLPLIENPLGIILLVLALGLNLAGGFVILKIVKIKV